MPCHALIGIIGAAGTLVMAGRAKNEPARFRYFKWTWTLTACTVVTLAAGVYIEQVLEDKWVRRTAKQRSVDISDSDVGRPMIELHKLIDRVKRFQEASDQEKSQVSS